MSTAILRSPAASVLDLMIRVYQRFVSPYKGFGCAYRIRRKRQSCSQYARRVVERFGLLRFVPLMRRRFDACKAAKVIDYETPRRKERKPLISPSYSTSDCTSIDPIACDVGCDCGGALLGEILNGW